MMRAAYKVLSVLALMPFALCATNYYVDGVNGANSRSGTSWANAKETIAAAYSLAGNGDAIYVADGVYEKINVNGEKIVTIKSVNGASSTVIDGAGTSRCASFFYNDWSTPYTDTIVDGFTLRGGYRDGSGGAAYGGTFKNCRIEGNKCTKSGGAGYGSYMYNCTIVSNTAGNCAGAVYGGRIESCAVLCNAATNWGGAFYECDVVNSVIAGNSCGRYGGAAYDSNLIGCTVFSNTADLGGGGVYGGSATNTILWVNKTGTQISNWQGGKYGYCVMKPLAEGIGNSDANPLLYDVSQFDGRICTGSSCVNAGCNAAVATSTDLAGNERIQGGIVDIGAYEGAVNLEPEADEDVEKDIYLKPGVSSSFVFDDGSSAFVFGVTPLTAKDFKETSVADVLRFENSKIIDAEKSSQNSDDDLWCQVMTEVNLCVWSGWSQCVGMTNEDDFADYMRDNAAFTESTNVLKWVLSRAGVNYNTYVKWSWATNDTGTVVLVRNLIDKTINADRWIYLQLDWVNDGTIEKIGSHAITCCGYQLKNGATGDSPEDLIGLFIIDSDNDKNNGVGGRYAFNSITKIPVEWDANFGRFFLKYPNKTGMLRFLCYLERGVFNDGVASVLVEGVPIPFHWLIDSGVYDPLTGRSASQVANGGTGKFLNGAETMMWQEYVAGTDPMNETSVFEARISMVDGKPQISWSPDLNENGTASNRVYTIWGRESLDDQDAWSTPPNSLHRFFKVCVEMK